MQYFFIAGLAMGYPVSEQMGQAKYAFWGLATATLLSGLGSFFSLTTESFVKGETDTSFQMSLATVVLKRVAAD